MSGTPTTAVTVLIVDPVADRRQQLARLLDRHGPLRVAGMAADGMSAARLVEQLRPTLVLLDADLPSAAVLVRGIMSDMPTPVVVLAAPDQRSRESALTSLAEGALSVQLRPEAADDETRHDRFRTVMTALADVKVVRRRRVRTATPSVSTSAEAIGAREGGSSREIAVIAIGASTGGPQAVQRLLGALPSDLTIPVLVVQHLASGFVDHLARTLRAASSLPTEVATDGQPLLAGHVYLGPEDRHLTVTSRGRIRLHDGVPISGFRPSATVLFASVAEAYGARGAAVILSGMGTDGLAGLRSVHAANGMVLAQDEATAAVYGMPGAAVAARLADLVAPVEDLAAHIAEHTRGAER